MSHPGVQRLRGALGAELVPESEPHAEYQDDTDHRRIDGVAERERKTGGDEQQDEDGAFQLAAEHHPRLRFVSAHRVGSHRDQSRGSFDAAETAHFGAESNENLHG